MPQAIIVTLVLLAVLAVIGMVVYRRFFANREVKATSKLKVSSIGSVGVSARDPKVRAGQSTHKAAGSMTHSAKLSPSEDIKRRFTFFGVFSGIVFAALGIKLWFMQIVQSESYKKQANENTYTVIKTPAPRGVIYDRNGIALVENRPSLTVLADADVAQDRDVLLRLSVALGLPYGVVRERASSTASGAHSQRVIAKDISLRQAAFLAEHSDVFQGITTQTRTERSYPYGDLAAHVLGYTGAVTDEDLKQARKSQDIEMGDAVGRSGAEASFENLLAGDHGQRKLVADADGNIRQVVSETKARKGSDVYLTIDARVQKVADDALKAQVSASGVASGAIGSAGAVVCMDVENGDIIALSNFPTFNPEEFIGGISSEVWKRVNSKESHYPLMNRCIAGAYPAGSTYKAFSGLAGLHYGYADSSRTWNCQGVWKGFGEKYPQHCWDLNGHGVLGFHHGIVVSCDVVFYEIAKAFWEARQKVGIDALQNFIKQFGFQKKTGIDLSGEIEGRVPTPEWKAEQFKDAPEQAAWLPGDMSNMAIGQGYVLVTPIQLAVAYGGVATGKLIQPHVFKEARNSQGDVVVQAQVTDTGEPQVEPVHYDIMRSALKGVIDEDERVNNAFQPIKVPAAGKTGTAEVAGKEDFGLFVCYAPFDKPKYAVACVIEEGKGGASSASPVAAKVLEAALLAQEGKLDIKLNRTQG